ncbi:hypothetical protein PENTCL1PPCAC_3459, partial [Pristionchus entomophagus]
KRKLYDKLKVPFLRCESPFDSHQGQEGQVQSSPRVVSLSARSSLLPSLPSGGMSSLLVSPSPAMTSTKTSFYQMSLCSIVFCPRKLIF